jgi:hypothetical protein
MEQALVIFGLWGIWTVGAHWFKAPEWFWILLVMALGLVFEAVLDRDIWYLGIGAGSAAAFLMRLSDLLLVTTDWVRVAVLRHRR